MKTNKLTIDGNKVMIGYQEIENINYIDVSYKDDGSYKGSIEFNTGVKADETIQSSAHIGD